MLDRKSPITLLIFGMFVIVLSVVYTYIGKISDHSFGWVERAKDPAGYWMGLVLYYFVGFGFVVYYLYKVEALSWLF